jgi:hypothetical protein
MLAEACTWPVNECDQVTMSLEIFGRSWEPFSHRSGLNSQASSPQSDFIRDYEDGHAVFCPAGMTMSSVTFSSARVIGVLRGTISSLIGYASGRVIIVCLNELHARILTWRTVS